MSLGAEWWTTRALFVALLGGALAACSSADAEAESPDTRSRVNTGESGKPGDNGAGNFGTSTDAAAPSVADGCADSTKLVYTVDSSKTLRRFDPETASFTTVGVIDCPSTAGTNSMAVDRNGIAWVLYTDGHLFKVQTKDASCEATSFEPNQANIATFGMGFASDAADSTNETLYVAGYPPENKLASISLDTLKLDVIAPINGANARAELSGTGGGQLFGLFEGGQAPLPGLPGSRYMVAEVAKSSAQLISKAPQSNVGSQPGNFAFAAWGGDFWLFIGRDVHRYRPTTKETTKVASVDFSVVGAGVSTCAPHAPPVK